MTTNTSRYLIVPMMVLSLTVLLAPANAQMTCPTTDDMLSHLPTCTTHHYHSGDINNKGVYQSLLAKANNAVALNDQGNSEAAVNLLNALINELEAQRGNHVDANAADMLIMHAEMAIDEISG